MRHIPALALLRVLRLLLPLVTCSWGPVVAFPNWSNSDDLVHLYTSSNLRVFHLQIHPDGRVDGSPTQTVDSALIIKSVSIGNVQMMGAKSGLNLCMESNGKLFGSRSFSEEDCVFKHTLLENGFDVYESLKHNFLVSLGEVKGPLVPNMKLPRFSDFLVRRNEVPLSQFNTPRPQPGGTRDPVANPCGGVLDGKIPEEMPLVDGIHPCFIEGGEQRDPNGATLSRKFPSPRTDS